MFIKRKQSELRFLTFSIKVLNECILLDGKFYMDDESTFIFKGIGGAANSQGPSCVQLISNLRVFAVPPISRGSLIHISIFIPKGYWRCGQYPRWPSYVSLFSCPKGIGGAANTPGASYVFFIFIPNGYWRCCQYPGGPSYVSLFSCLRDIGGAANTPESLIHMFNFTLKVYWRHRQYFGAPHTYV